MKRKIEYVALVLVIVAVGSYLYFKRTDRVHYDIPRLEEIDARAVTSLEISSWGGSVTLSRRGGEWVLSPSGYPADAQKARKLLHDVAALTLTDLVSDSKNYDRYDLGEKDRITVKAHAGARVLRQFVVGKTAPTSRHTYVMLPGNPSVYQAMDSFREDFQGDGASFRLRKVLGFSMDGITKVSVRAGSAEAAYSRQVSPDKPGKPAAWVNGSGKEASRPDMDLLVSSLSSLECSGFLDHLEKGGLGAPVAVVTLTGDREHSLSIYPETSGGVPLTSSGYDSVFTLQDYQLDAIRKAVDKLAGAL